MPINWIHGKLHRIDHDWDPVSQEHSEWYNDFVSKNPDRAVVDKVEELSGGLCGKSLLDLGGGPGHFSVLFAQRGAEVTWHDVSRVYRNIAERRAANLRVNLQFSLGYLEDASRLGASRFDLIFCRVCWCYSRSDRAFARLIYSLLKSGGACYIECNTPTFSKPKGLRKVQYLLNEWFWWKIGHPMPPHGRIAKLIQRYPVERLQVDYSSEMVDIIQFVKASKQT